MDTQPLQNLVKKGHIEQVIKELNSLSGKYNTPFNKDINHTSARYYLLMRDKNNGISTQDFKLVENSIIFGLQGLIESLNELNFDKVKLIASPPQIKKEIKKLAVTFDKCQDISNNPTRVRMKNHIAQQICEKFVQAPDLIYLFQDSDSEGIICGISEKIKTYPDVNDLHILEKIAKKAQQNFTKGNIVNALAEIIYLGQIRLGDDSKIEDILTLLNKHTDIPLEKNIDRVRAALHFLKSSS